MSVFNRSKRNREVEATHFANGEEIPCRNGHRWDGEILKVDSSIHEVQFPQYIGKPCDCGKLIYESEGMCSCPGKKKWESKMIPAE